MFSRGQSLKALSLMHPTLEMHDLEQWYEVFVKVYCLSCDGLSQNISVMFVAQKLHVLCTISFYSKWVLSLRHSCW